MLAYTDIVSEEATFLPGKKYPKDRFIETYDFVYLNYKYPINIPR